MQKITFSVKTSQESDCKTIKGIWKNLLMEERGKTYLIKKSEENY
jgi:hypothetical protein